MEYVNKEVLKVINNDAIYMDVDERNRILGLKEEKKEKFVKFKREDADNKTKTCHAKEKGILIDCKELEGFGINERNKKTVISNSKESREREKNEKFGTFRNKRKDREGLFWE